MRSHDWSTRKLFAVGPKAQKFMEDLHHDSQSSLLANLIDGMNLELALVRNWIQCEESFLLIISNALIGIVSLPCLFAIA